MEPKFPLFRGFFKPSFSLQIQWRRPTGLQKKKKKYWFIDLFYLNIYFIWQITKYFINRAYF